MDDWDGAFIRRPSLFSELFLQLPDNIGDEIAVPAFGLSRPSTDSPPGVHAQAWAAHIVYGVTAELVRRGGLSDVRGAAGDLEHVFDGSVRPLHPQHRQLRVLPGPEDVAGEAGEDGCELLVPDHLFCCPDVHRAEDR